MTHSVQNYSMIDVSVLVLLCRPQSLLRTLVGTS